MIAQTPRDPWRAIWQVAISDGLLIALLLGVSFGLTLTAWLPQMPLADPSASAQWLSMTQARFGQATATMQALGLFTITHSFGFRALLALLGGCLLLRLIEGSERFRRNREMAQPAGEWRSLADLNLPDAVSDLRDRRYRVLGESPLFQADRWPWADLFPLLIHTGALLLLAGLLITYLWGWQVEGLIVQSGEQAALDDAEKWVALDKDGRGVTHSPGIVTFVEQRGPGVQASAADETRHPLALYQTTESTPVTQLRIVLTEERYFAIPEAQMVIRLVAQPEGSVLVQVYRSPPGQLITGQVVEGDAELEVEGVTLEFASVPYARITATFNPGLWPSGIGIVLLLVGLLGSVAWPARRFWLREEAERVQAAGGLPPTLAQSEEG